MISKLAKAHESWIFKFISAAVAVSFVSLFGVTGYINSASQNQTVVDVEGLKTTQSEFSYRVQKELNALKNLTSDDFELTDDMRNAITEGEDALGEVIVRLACGDKTVIGRSVSTDIIEASLMAYINGLNKL